jgi:hypothetical protein
MNGAGPAHRLLRAPLHPLKFVYTIVSPTVPPQSIISLSVLSQSAKPESGTAVAGELASHRTLLQLLFEHNFGLTSILPLLRSR